MALDTPGRIFGDRATLTMDDKETLIAEIGQLQVKYTVAVKAYGIIKNTAERGKAKALIASLGKQIDDLKKRLKALPMISIFETSDGIARIWSHSSYSHTMANAIRTRPNQDCHGKRPLSFRCSCSRSARNYLRWGPEEPAITLFFAVRAVKGQNNGPFASWRGKCRTRKEETHDVAVNSPDRRNCDWYFGCQ